MTESAGMSWVRGSFIVPDISDDECGLDRTIGVALVSLAEAGVTMSGSSGTGGLDSRLAAVLVGLFRADTPWGSVWHARERDGAELHIVFDGTGSAEAAPTIEAAMRALADLGVEGQVERTEIGYDGPSFVRWTLERGEARFDDAGSVIYTR